MNSQELKSKQERFKKWVNEFSDDLYSWAIHKTNNKIVAEDLVQETFLSAFRGYESFKFESTPKTWLLRILNNKIIDHYRKSARSMLSYATQSESSGDETVNGMFDRNNNWKANGHEALWEEESHLLNDQDFLRVMDFCINDLPPTWKTVMTWKYHLGKDGGKICKELGITASNYWQVVHRAKLMLKKCLEIKWFGK